MHPTLAELIKSEEANYKLPVPVADGYEWSMYKHILLTILYKNSQFETKGEDRPFRNIILPILRVQYRSEGFDVKDIELFVNSAKEYYKSFLIRKYHEKWARENGLDSFIDDMVESYVDFGGALVKDVNGKCPELVPLQSIAFCDQTDILSGPLAIKHNYSPDQLKAMESKGWGKFGTTVDELIILAENAKNGATTGDGQKAKTPGKYIEVYEVHGTFPKHWLNDKAPETTDAKEYEPQVHIVAFYQQTNGQKDIVTLFRGKERVSPFKIVLRDKIFGRALGLGGAEELFESQVWTNSSVIHMQNMLEQASKILYQTDDPAYAKKNQTKGLKNGQILDLAEGKKIEQINTQPVNLPAFEKSVFDWRDNAQTIGAAGEAIQGDQPASGTPFKLQELVTAEAHSIHEYRKGKLATFLDEIYRDWIIPRIAAEVSRGTEFLSELSLEELQSVADCLVTAQANDKIKEHILNGEVIDEQQIELFKQEVRDQFMKGGNKRFIEIFADEFRDSNLDVYVNIAGKQKDIAGKTDKIVNLVRFIMTTYNPNTGSFAAFDDPRMAGLLNEAIEFSGMTPIDFYQKPKVMKQESTVPQQQEEAAVV